MKEPVPLTDSEIRGIRYCLRNPTGDKWDPILLRLPF